MVGFWVSGAAAFLTEENLIADFGRRSGRAQQALTALSRASGNGRSSRATEPAKALRLYFTIVVRLTAERAGARDSVVEEYRDEDVQKFMNESAKRLRAYRLLETPQDLFKGLYQDLFPKGMRHDLGEYYTPDWLAERVLVNTLGRDLGDPAKRVLDPACGSGTFLVLLIRHIRSRAAREKKSAAQTVHSILQNVTGVDVNPLAVMAARANYRVALGDLVDANDTSIEIPVYQADAITAAGEEVAKPCDYIVGNPPWVNWEDLAEDYRRAALPLWDRYGLLPKRATAMETILGGAKYDLSMLMTYVAADRYLLGSGRLGFLVPQTILKSPKAGRGFRRFRLPDGTPLAPVLAEDFSESKPFGAANRTALLVLRKGQEARYPVEYRYCKRDGEICFWKAQPIVAGDPESSWITARSGMLNAAARLQGGSPYRAREGANTGGANAVFWIEVTGREGARLRVRNVVHGSRTPVPAVRAQVEPGLVYPLLRGQNVARWNAQPGASMVLPHRPGMRLRAIPEKKIAAVYPRTSSYLARFEPLLRARPAFRRYFKRDAPFYSMFNIGDYTFAAWKVVWREQARRFTAAVCGPVGGRPVIADHKLMLVATDSEEEAHYLCGALNSLPVRAAVGAYAVSTQIDTHVLEHVAVPKFDNRNSVHRKLAFWSRAAHRSVASGDSRRLAKAEAGIDEGAARLWQMSEADCAEMRKFLKEAGAFGA